MAREKLIKASGLPYTIVHSTQFFEFLGGIAASGGDGQSVRLSPALVQPITSSDVADILADITLEPPLNGTLEIAGPERLSLAALVQRYLVASADRRSVVADLQAPYFGALLNDRTLVPGAAPRLGSIGFEAWFSQSRV